MYCEYLIKSLIVYSLYNLYILIINRGKIEKNVIVKITSKSYTKSLIINGTLII